MRGGYCQTKAFIFPASARSVHLTSLTISEAKNSRLPLAELIQYILERHLKIGLVMMTVNCCKLTLLL